MVSGLETDMQTSLSSEVQSPRKTRGFGGRYGNVLQNKRFRMLWFSQLFGSIGSTISMIVLPLYVYELTGSAGKLGAVFVAQRIAQLLVNPLTGVVADRVNRRRVMLTCDLSRAILLSFMPFTQNLWSVAVIAVLVSIATSFAIPAELAAVPTLVPSDDLVPALSLTQVSSGVMRIVGPAIGGSIFGLVGARPAFWFQAVIYTCSFLCLLRLDLVTTVTKTTGRFLESTWGDFVDGLRTVWHVPIVRAVTATETLWSLVAASLSIAGVVYTKETLDLGDRASTAYAFLMASMSAGAVIGALIAHRAEARIGRSRLLIVGYLGPLFFVPVIFSPPLWLNYILWFLAGFTDAWAVISFQSYLAEAVPDELRGRVYATWGAMITFGALVSSGVVAWSTSHLSAELTIGLSGLIVGLGGPLLLVAAGATSSVRSPHVKTA
jgi:NRE family putative nickel resistance protein-like MFS transporter